ncbi:MAG: TonB-dependent siderophore receptor [Parahaliea sp.]
MLDAHPGSVLTANQHNYGTLRLQLLDRLKAIVGGRLNNYEFTQNDGDGNRTTRYKDDNVFVPFFAVSYDVSPDWLFYMSVAETFKSQASYWDENEKPLDPVTGRSYELGVKGELWSGRATASLAIYRTEREGEASLVSERTINDGNGSSCCYSAAGETLIEGFEAEVSGEVLPNLTAAVGYSYQDKSKDDVNAFKWRNTTLPRHMLKVWLDYKFENWTLGVNAVAQSEQYSTGRTPTVYDETTGTWGEPYVDYRFSSGGRAVWGTSVGYQLSSNIKATLSVNNLFDKHYWQTIGTASGYNWYGEPRNYMLSLRAEF